LTRQTIIVVSRHIEYDLRNDFLSHIQRLDLAYFQNTPTGDLMAHATNDVNAVRNVLGPGIMYSSDTFVGFVIILSIMLVMNTKLTLLALIPFPFVSYSVYRLGTVVHHQFEKVQSQYADLTTKVQENLSGIRVIKAYVRELYEIAAFRNLSWEYLKRNMSLAMVQALMWPMMFMLTGLSLIIVIWAGGLEPMARRRDGRSGRELASGPGRLTQAFGIGLEHDAASALRGPLRIEAGRGEPSQCVLAGPRIGIRKAADLPYRFWLADSPHVTRTPLNRRAIMRPR